MSTAEIKKFWDEMADTHGESFEATVPDGFAKDLEIEAICRHLKDGDVIADVGCGNGYSCFKYLEQVRCDITGLDYSQKMIDHANSVRDRAPEEIKSALRFAVGSVLDTQLPSNHFDKVITDRVIINLMERDEQAAVLPEMARILKPGGYYLMCENTEQTLANLNEVRELAGLPTIAVRWHNRYMDADHMRAAWEPYFELVEEHRFGSFYYLASRIINAMLADENGEVPSYTSPINRVAAKISAKIDCGDYCPVKLYVLKKK